MNWASFTLGFLVALFIAWGISSHFCGKAVAQAFHEGQDVGYRRGTREGFHTMSVAHRVFGRAVN